MPTPPSGARIPDYERVIAGITDRIADRTWPPGSRLPSIAQLAELFATSQTTVKTALAILRRDGTIRTHPGKGTFVPGDGDGGDP